MKKIVFLMLVTSITSFAFAQYDRTVNVYLNNSTERLFNYPAPGRLQTRFEFLLGKGNKMVLELNNISQFSKIINPDSIVRKVWAALQPFKDSLTKPLINWRIDFVITGVDERVRITEYPQRAEIYRIKANEITQLKVEQDTLRIKLYPPGKEITIRPTNEKRLVLGQPYFIMLLLNNISDVESLNSDDLSKGFALLKNDFDKDNKLKKNKPSYSSYYAMYDVPNNRKISPVKGNIAWGRRNEVIPFIPIGIQYVRGTMVPSTGAGVEWKFTNGQATNYYRLYWEPLFDFGRNADKKLITNINSFVTFKYTENTKDAVTRDIIFALNFSVGHLIKRQGDLFEKNTTKFSLPGFQMKNALLEPEFVFNKFFRNFSPSLKLCLYFE